MKNDNPQEPCQAPKKPNASSLETERKKRQKKHRAKHPLGHGEQAAMAKLQKLRDKQLKKARREFTHWKKEIVNMINKESGMIENPDGKFSYLLPRRLIKLVWEVMITERLKINQQANPEGDIAQTIKQVKADFEADTEKANPEGQGPAKTKS